MSDPDALNIDHLIAMLLEGKVTRDSKRKGFFRRFSLDSKVFLPGSATRHECFGWIGQRPTNKQYKGSKEFNDATFGFRWEKNSWRRKPIISIGLDRFTERRSEIWSLAEILHWFSFSSSWCKARKKCSIVGKWNSWLMFEISGNFPVTTNSFGTGGAIENMW